MCYRKPGPRCMPALIMRLRDAEKALEERAARLEAHPTNTRYQQALRHTILRMREDQEQLSSTPLGLLVFGDAKRQNAKRWEALRTIREDANREHAEYQRRRRRILAEDPEQAVYRGVKQSHVPTIDRSLHDLNPRMLPQKVALAINDKDPQQVYNLIQDPRTTEENLITVARTVKNEELRFQAVQALAERNPERYAVLVAKVDERRASIKNS